MRAVPLLLLTVSKGGGAHFDGAVAEYAERVTRYTAFREVTSKPNPRNASEPEAQKVAEGEKLLKLIGARDRLVLLDERGKDLSSTGLADLLADAGEEGVPQLVFAIGGPHGHGAAMKERANVTIRLSACVLNHQVARLVLVEQLYRAWSILKGENYHHI